VVKPFGGIDRLLIWDPYDGVAFHSIGHRFIITYHTSVDCFLDICVVASSKLNTPKPSLLGSQLLQNGVGVLATVLALRALTVDVL
jgi:hypothetical protein